MEVKDQDLSHNILTILHDTTIASFLRVIAQMLFFIQRISIPRLLDMCKIEVYKYIDKTIKPNEGIKPLKGLIDNIGIANMLL